MPSITACSHKKPSTRDSLLVQLIIPRAEIEIPSPCRPFGRPARCAAFAPSKRVAELSERLRTESDELSKLAISMDGKGSWRDNVFVERLWRSVKYEEVYLRAYDSVAEARASIGRYLGFYNTRRPHSSLDRRTPYEAYFEPSPLAVAA